MSHSSQQEELVEYLLRPSQYNQSQSSHIHQMSIETITYKILELVNLAIEKFDTNVLMPQQKLIIQREFTIISNKIYQKILLNDNQSQILKNATQQRCQKVFEEYHTLTKKYIVVLQDAGYNKNAIQIEQIKEQSDTLNEDTKSDFQHFLNVFNVSPQQSCCNPGLVRKFKQMGQNQNEVILQKQIPCIKYINMESFIEFYFQFQEKMPDEQDQFIYGQIASFLYFSKRAKSNTYKYNINGERCCKDFYLSAIGKTGNYLYPRIKSFEEGSQTKFDQRGGARNFLQPKTYEFLLLFLKDFINSYGEHHPGKNNKIMLPSHMSRHIIYNLYTNSIDQVNKESQGLIGEQQMVQPEVIQKSSLSTFKLYLNLYYGSPQRLSDKTDYCDTCFCLKKDFRDCENIEEKVQIEQTLKEHLENIKQDRLKYTKIVSNSKLELNLFLYGNNYKIKTLVISYDYAQNWLIPKYKTQPGSLYFISRQKVGIFGINFEADNVQTNYFLRENEMKHFQKGANLTISLLYHYLQQLKQKYQSDNLIVYFDNAGGQNKNNTTIQFYHWLIYYKCLFKQVEILTMEPGHTKFSPDQHFGQLKSAYNQQDCVETYQDCVNVGRSISKQNIVIDLKQSRVPILDWDECLTTLYYKCNPNLKIFQKHYYRLVANDPNLYYKYKFCDNEYSCRLHQAAQRSRRSLPQNFYFVEKIFQQTRLQQLEKLRKMLTVGKESAYFEGVYELKKGYE